MKKRIAKRLTSAAIFAALFLFVPAIFEFTKEYTTKFFLEQQPASEFFVYHKIEPVKRIYSFDEDLKFVSFNDVHKKLNFEWNDILRCDYDGQETGFVNIGSVQNRANGIEPHEGSSSTWNWDGPRPDGPAHCYLEANITAEVGYGVKKTQRILSDDFRIE